MTTPTGIIAKSIDPDVDYLRAILSRLLDAIKASGHVHHARCACDWCAAMDAAHFALLDTATRIATTDTAATVKAEVERLAKLQAAANFARNKAGQFCKADFSNHEHGYGYKLIVQIYDALKDLTERDNSSRYSERLQRERDANTDATELTTLRTALQESEADKAILLKALSDIEDCDAVTGCHGCQQLVMNARAALSAQSEGKDG